MTALDSAEVLVYTLDPVTGVERRVQISPVMTTIRYFGKCATYDLDSEKIQMSRIRVYSPLDIVVLLHDQNQQNIHRELSVFFQLEGRNRLAPLSTHLA